MGIIEMSARIWKYRTVALSSSPTLQSLQEVSAQAHDGLTLDLSSVTSYTAGTGESGLSSNIQANGAGSEVDLSGVTSFIGGKVYVRGYCWREG